MPGSCAIRPRAGERAGFAPGLPRHVEEVSLSVLMIRGTKAGFSPFAVRNPRSAVGVGAPLKRREVRLSSASRPRPVGETLDALARW